jgi:SAM-dependent MidA family methyltransferase
MPEDSSPLESEIRRLIAIAGPMPLAEYMRLCLTHPEHGYYLVREAIGAAGDFVTAPEISQMFGELVGLWSAAVWQQMGAPENIRIIELGPGRGTMIRDALRAAKIVKGFHSAVVLHLVEINPKLKEAQRQVLHGFDVPALWHEALADVPPGPSIILANEFIDALPRSARMAIWSSASPRSRCHTSTPPCRVNCGKRRKTRSSNGVPTRSRWRSAGACAMRAPL